MIKKVRTLNFSKDFLNILPILFFLSFFIFPPSLYLGLIAMYFSSWPKTIKIIVTIIAVIILVFLSGVIAILQGWRAG